MQILYWHLTRPQASTCDGSTSPPLLERRDGGTSLSARLISRKNSTIENFNIEANNSHNSTEPGTRLLPPLSVPRDAGGARQSPNKNMEIENDDQTPTFYLLNAVDVPVDEESAINQNHQQNHQHHLELIQEQNNHDNPYNGPLVAVGNGAPGEGGNNGGNGPPEGHYTPQPRKGVANKRKKRRSNELASVLCFEDESEDESAVNIGPSKSKKAKLIVNLYSEEQGYSYGYQLPGSSECSESHAIPYSERYLLDSIDAEQIPHKVLCKLEDKDGVCLMRYRNQVIAEIRDYRKSLAAQSNITATVTIPGRSSIAIHSNGSASVVNGRVAGNESQGKPVVKQVMLRPTTESLLCDFDLLVDKAQQDRGGWNAVFRQSSSSGDVSHLVPCGSDNEFEYEVDLVASQKSECNYLTYDRRLELERKFVNRTAGPVCLDPSPQVGLIANRVQFEKFKWNTDDMRRAAKRWEENPFKSNKMIISTPDGSLNAPSLSEGRLDIDPFYNFVMSVKSKRELSSRTFGVDKDALRLPPIQYQDYPLLDPPKNIEEILRIGQIPEPAQLRVFPNENFVRKIEEYILETERRKRPHTTTLSIFQRNGMESFFGELEMESFLDPTQPRIGSPPASTKCQFELGSSRNVTLYVKQFSDIFTEDGRRPCKITYQKVGQPPQVVYTNSYKSAASPTPPTPSTSATSPSTPPPNQTITAITASVPQIVTTLSTPIVVNAAPCATSTVSVASPVCSTIVTSASQLAQAIAAVSSPGAVPTSISVPGIVSVSQQSGVQLQRAPTPVSATNIVVSGTMPAAATATTAPTLPPVQIVHPQPRTTPLQQQQQQQQQPQKPQATGQRQIQIFSQQQAQPQTVTLPQSPSPAAANVNLNVNLNSPGISGITPHQVLTRPQIVNVNLQQQQQAAAQQQLLQQTIQQRIFRMKQQQPNPTLAKLLLSSIQTKPITVAVQPTPQNPVNVASANNSVVCSSSASSVASCSSTINSNATTNSCSNSTNVITSQGDQPQVQPNPLGSPIMITSPPSASSAITNPSSNVNVNVNASPNLSVNLNTISLDGLLAASSANVNYGNATLTTNQAGSNLVAASNVNLGLSRITTSSGQPAVNILRLNNSTGTVATATGGNTVQLAAVQRQLAVSNALNGNVSILQQGSQQPQQRILINANSMNNLNLNSVGSGGEIDELSVPDLTTLLGGQPIQISQLGQQQHILTNATGAAPSQTTIDTTNLNLNLNVNLNSGTVVNNGESQVQQHQIAKIQGGEWTTTAQAPPFLVFISPLRPMSIATQAQAQATRHVTTAATVTNPSGLSLNLGAVQQQPQQQIVQSQPGKVPEGPTRILLGACNNGVAIKREAITSVSGSTSSVMTSVTSVAGTGSDNNNLSQQNQLADSSNLDTSGGQLLDSQQVGSSSDVVVDGVDSLFNALSEAIGPEQLQKLDAIGGSLTAAAAAASAAATSNNIATPQQIPSSGGAETIPTTMRIVSSNSVVNLGSAATTSVIPSSASISSISNNSSSKSNNSTNVITLSDLLGSPTVVSSAGSISSYSPIILNNITNSSSGSGSSNSSTINSSPTLSSLLNSSTVSMGGGLLASSSSSSPASVTSTVVTQSSIVSSTPRLSALLAGTPSADTIVVGTNGPSSLLSPAGTADSSTGGTNSNSYGTLLDRLAASLNQPQGTTAQVRTGASRLNPIATATPSVVLDHPVLAATLTQPQQNTAVSSAAATMGVNRASPSTFRQIAPAPSPGTSSIGNTSSTNTVTVINASDVQSHAIQSPQLINLLGLVGNNTGTGAGQTRTIRINASSPANNPSPGSASR